MTKLVTAKSKIDFESFVPVKREHENLKKKHLALVNS